MVNSLNIIIYIILIISITITCNTCYANTIINNKFINVNYLFTIFIIIIFISCYIFIITEEFTGIKKSTSTLLSAGAIWILITLKTYDANNIIIINNYIKKVLIEYCELLLFLVVAIIYINTIKIFGILNKIKYIIITKKLTYKKIYWLTGFLSFFISPIADNLTTALLMCSIIISIANKNKTFINISCINIIIAVNAGGAFSPFGDITTLMIWQNDIIKFKSFFNIFIPSFISFLIPAIIISHKIENNIPFNLNIKKKPLKKGSKYLILLFSFTIIFTIILQHNLHLPSTIGMMTGLGLLYIFEYTQNKNNNTFSIYNQIKKINWDTLFFFYGIMLCISGLSVLGILDCISNFIYNDISTNINIIHKQTPANIIIGLLSAFIDNIPITFAVLNMNPNMSEGQWLLVTLTSGIGGSLLSIGSAAGIAVMAQAKNIYTFFSHLKWSWAILIGYILGIITHIQINKNLFT